MLRNEEMSMLEVAEMLIQRKIKPQKFDKIAKEVCQMMGLSDEEFKERLAQFYSDLTLSGKFVTVGEDKWDLKSRQKYDVANYDSYDIDFDDEEEVKVSEDGFDSYEDKDEHYEEKDTNDSEEEKELDTEDDFGDESDAEVNDEEDELVGPFEGLEIISEDELE